MFTWLGLAGIRIIISPKWLAAELGVFSVMPLVRQLLKFISFNVADITEHKTGMHIQQRPNCLVFTMRI